MAISYPITLPSTIKPSSVEWIECNTVGVSQSPYTKQQQVYEWSGSFWKVRADYEAMTRLEAQALIAAFSSLHGSRGTFYFGDYLFAAALGSPSGTPRVNGASQIGFELITDGWPNSTLVLKAGDMFQIGTSLYRNLSDATTNGSGQATLNIWPQAHNHADNSLITTSSPVGVFRLVDNQIKTQDAPRDRHYRISFVAVEAL